MGTIQLRQANTKEEALNSNAIFKAGEPGVALETGEIRIGNGTDRWADLPSTETLVRDALNSDAARDDLDERYTKLTDVRVWSNPLRPAGSGGDVIRIDATAAPNIPDFTSASGSRGVIAIGRNTLFEATAAPGCIAVGGNAMGKGTPGAHNIAIGGYSLTHLNGGHRNIGIGSLAGHFMTTGFQNTLIGRDSGHSITEGSYNVGIGYRATSCVEAPVGLSGEIELQHRSTGGYNTGIGTNALTYMFGSDNAALGYMAGARARNLSNTVFVGSKAGQSLGSDVSENGFTLNRTKIEGTYEQTGRVITVTAANHGLVIGKYVSLTFTSGELSAAGAGQWMQVENVNGNASFTVRSPVEASASGNVSVDERETGVSVALAGSNVYVGYMAFANTTRSGGNNVAVGESVGLNATGGKLTLIGGRSGYNMTSGTDITGIGYNSARATWAGAQLTDLTNVTSLGHESRPVGSNSVMIGNSTQDVYTRDGTVKGPSDERDKADIRDTSLGLEFIKRITPREFRWDQRAFYTDTDDDGNIVQVERDGSRKRNRFHQGVIAQELVAVTDDLGVDFAGLQHHEPDDGEDIFTVSYTEFIAPLIRAVQELSERVEAVEAA